MSRLIVICLLAWFTMGPALAQTKNRDSLITVQAKKRMDSLRVVLAKHPQLDTFRVNRLIDLAGNDLTTLPETQRDSLLQEINQLSRRLHYPYGEGASLMLQSIIQYYMKDQKQQGVALLKQALPLAEQSNQKDFIMAVLDGLGRMTTGRQSLVYQQRALSLGQSIPLLNKTERLFRMHDRIVDSYIDEGDYPLALQWGLSLLARVEKDTNSVHHYLALSGLGTIYSRLKDYNNALIYLKRSQRVALKRNDRAQQGATLTHIGRIYQQLGQPDMAIETFQKALSLVTNLREDWVINIEAQLADSYQQKGLYKQAFVYAHRALGAIQTKKHKDVFNYFDGYKRTIFKTLSQTHLHTGQLDSAFYYAQQSLLYSRQLVDKQFIRDAHQVLAQVYAAKRDYANAYQHQSEFMAFKDSLNNEEITRKTTATQFTFEMDRQKSQIALLTKDKQLQAEKARRLRLLQEAKADQLTYELGQNQSQITLLNKDKQLQAEQAHRKEFIQQAQAARLQSQMSVQQQETRRQRLLLLSSLAVLTLLIGLAVVLYRNNRNKQRANAQLQRQKVEIQHQRDELNQTLTELKATQQQLIQKEKMASLGELTAGIAHEIQNPLNFVNNFSEVSTELVDELKAELTKGDVEEAGFIAGDLAQNLQKIQHHGRRASSIVKGMLEHSRSGVGERQPTDLNALADEYLKLAYHGLRAKDKTDASDRFNCELVTNFDPALEPIEVAPQEIGRVLVNLYTNAFYAVSQRASQTNDPAYRPTVEVSTQRLANVVVIRIKDNGTGIPAGVVNKVFQPFFTTKPTGEGTGLGLSLSYDIVTKGHGGSLTLESQEGQGTQFVIQLPVTA